LPMRAERGTAGWVVLSPPEGPEQSHNMWSARAE
jgi:hypothetical protein